jgi:hypothetical protein
MMDPAPPKRFKFAARKAHQKLAGLSVVTPTIMAETELTSYLVELETLAEDTVAKDYWVSQEIKYPNLSKLAEDLVCAPASQAYVERVFSVCGDLAARKRNRVTVKLEERVFLKVNARVLDALDLSKLH